MKKPDLWQITPRVGTPYPPPHEARSHMELRFKPIAK